MSFPDISAKIPTGLRGAVRVNEPLAPLTWFRVGGPAQLLFMPADEEDLALFLAGLPQEIPVTVIGLGSNLIVRDGGVPGVVVRLSARGFGEIKVEEGHRLRIGAAAPDVKAARAAAEAGIDGLAFYRGIPGAIGGALRMNAGAHGGETKDALIEACGVTRAGERRRFSNADMGFSYRHCGVSEGVIFTQALFQGRPGDREAILAEMDRITAAREASQPIREKTGGSTFANPAGHKAWQLIDAAGCRGLARGDAQVSEMHCNFLINRGAATAADIEGLGEEVRARVKVSSGVELRWEIKRIGVAG
jgi:UDP-N-acetylmuramate dehydrogenase